MKPTLQFVYNAETGYFNKLTDFAHKIISPGTYACSLCALTYGNFTIRQEWADYVRQLPLAVEFIYKNEWEFAQVDNNFPLVALKMDEQHVKVLLEAEQLNSFRSLEQLKQAIDKVLQLDTM